MENIKHRTGNTSTRNFKDSKMNRTEKYVIQKSKTVAAKHKIGAESCCCLNECLNEKKKNSLLKKTYF